MEIPKKGILMAYVNNHRKWFGIGFPKKGYFDGLYKQVMWLTKKGNFDGLYKQIMWPTKKRKMEIVYISRSCDFPKKENLMDYISIFGRYFLKNYQKRKFNGLCEQITWPTKKWKWRVGWGAYIMKSCDFPKKEILMDYIRICRRYFPKITKNGNLMAYVSRSHDPPKNENGDQVGMLT